MAVYMVTYDLNNPGQRYDDVIQAIKEASTGVWCTYREGNIFDLVIALFGSIMNFLMLYVIYYIVSH